MAKKIFLSYAHASELHNQHVIELASSLRKAGLVVVFDGDVTSPQGPPQGWSQWMLDQIDEADWVLVVCDETYYKRFRGKEIQGQGLGVRWEGSIIRETLYSRGALNPKFIPVVPENSNTMHIPDPLRGATYYYLPRELPKLLAALAGENTSESSTRNAWMPEKAARNFSGSSTWPEIFPYALFSLGSFLGALVLASLLLWKAELLVMLGLTGNFYYITLLLLGLTVAGSLFGTLRSIGRFRGHPLGDFIDISIPVAGFALAILGGFYLPPNSSNFPTTVYVHGEAGPHELILRATGSVGTDRRRAPIGNEGQAFFPEIPASFRGQMVNLSLDAAGYEMATSKHRFRLDGTSLYLPVRKKAGRISGRVQDENGNPVSGVRIAVADLETSTDSFGRFALVIPGNRMQDEFSMQAVAVGYNQWNGSVIPNANEVVIQLPVRP
jgi:hypothetical protein